MTQEAIIKPASIKSGPPSSHLRGIDLNLAADLSGRNTTPFMLLRTSQVEHNLRRLRRVLPDVDVYYAVKANDHPAVIKTLLENNCYFDISSVRELQIVKECGGRAENTIHTNPVKSITEFDGAVYRGTRIFAADSVGELEKFTRYGDKAGVLLRFKTEPGGSVVNLSYKFGADATQITELLDRVIDLGLSFKGFCFHVGSQCTDTSKYISAITVAAELIELARDRGLETGILDIGGGFPIKYTENVPGIESIGKAISKALNEKIDASIRVVCEPGRFISGDAVTLFTSVIGKAVRDGIKWYYIDDGLYGSFSGCLFDHCTYQIVTNRNTKWEKAVLAGPTCDSFDVIYKECLLPPLETGDVLMFPAMGAYCRVSATTFNGLGQAPVIIFDR
jgi:ornithine decarboxylase